MPPRFPRFLYFFGLFVQIDARAASENLRGLSKEELPDLKTTLKEGWHHVFAFALLTVMLLVLQREQYAPFYATAVLLVVNQIVSKTDRWGKKELLGFIDSLARLFATLAATLGAVGMIVGGLSQTGLAGTLVNDLLHIAGGSPYLLLIMGAITSLILGTGMTATACYIFLAVMLAPALIQVGLDPLAVHLYIFYWGMLSFITPPVALGAFAAASIAKTPPMRTGFEAMKIGSVIYFIPFFFVFDPALIMHGTWENILISTALAFFGVWVFASGIQGYVVGVGPHLQQRTVRLGGAPANPAGRDPDRAARRSGAGAQRLAIARHRTRRHGADHHRRLPQQPSPRRRCSSCGIRSEKDAPRAAVLNWARGKAGP